MISSAPTRRSWLKLEVEAGDGVLAVLTTSDQVNANGTYAPLNGDVLAWFVASRYGRLRR